MFESDWDSVKWVPHQVMLIKILLILFEEVRKAANATRQM